MKLLHFTDAHLQLTPAPENQFHVQPFWRGEMRDLFERIGKAAESTDAIVFTGDATHGGGKAEAASFFERIAMAAGGRPIYMVLGNHDVVNLAWQENFVGQAQRYSNIHIREGIYPLGEIDILLMHGGYLTTESVVKPDWHPPMFPVPGLSEESSKALDSMLSCSSTRPAFVMTHCPSHLLPPVPVGFPPYVGPGMELYQKNVDALLDKHPRVRGMIAGHVHFNSVRVAPNGRVHQSLAAVSEAPCQVRLIELTPSKFESRLINLETGPE